MTIANTRLDVNTSITINNDIKYKISIYTYFCYNEFIIL